VPAHLAYRYVHPVTGPETRATTAEVLDLLPALSRSITASPAPAVLHPLAAGLRFTSWEIILNCHLGPRTLSHDAALRRNCQPPPSHNAQASQSTPAADNAQITSISDSFFNIMDDGDWGSPWADAANHRSRVDSDSRNQGQDIGSAARSTGISDADDASENLNASRNGDDAFGVSKTSPTAGDALWEGFEDSLAWADAGNAAVTGVAIETIPDWTAGGKDNGGLNSASVEMDTRKDGLDDEASGVWNRGRENSLVADGFSRWATGSDWDKTNTIHDNDGEENECWNHRWGSGTEGL